MPADHLPASVQTLYAELLELEQIAVAESASGPITGGTFVAKKIRGKTYWYLQRSEGSTVRQHYLGSDSRALRTWMEESGAARRSRSGDEATRRKLADMLRSGGATAEPAGVIKVLRVLAEAGVFRFGGVLVGTQAYRALGNLLGVRLGSAAARTQDLDIAADATIGVAFGGRVPPGEVERRLGQLEPPYLPVPGLDPRQPSTTFKVRGRQYRVDFLTPARRSGEEHPVRLSALGCAAQPVRFLEFLLEGTAQAVVVGAGSVLVNVPDPARFALHKLFTAGSRGATQQTKAGKDVAQAATLLDVLLGERPGDLAAAWNAISSRRARSAIVASVRSLSPDLRERLATSLSF
jgi:hypothetical protein